MIRVQGKQLKDYSHNVNGSPLPYQSDNNKPWTTPEEHGGTGQTHIQAAVSTGKNVFFKYGTRYELAGTVVAVSQVSQIYSGDGVITYQDGVTAGNNFMFNVFSCTDIVFDGVYFDGNKANVDQPPINDGWEGATERIYYTPITANGTTGLTVKDCEFANVCTVSLNLISCTDAIIRRNHFHDSYMDAIYTSTGFSNNVMVSQNVIKDLTYRDGNGDIVWRYANGLVINAQRVIISDCQFARVDRTGFKPTSIPTANGYQIKRNAIIDADWQGINPQGGYDFEIEDNYVHGSGWNALLLGFDNLVNPVYNLVIKRNQFLHSGIRDAGSSPTSRNGVFFSGDTYNVTMEDNLIDGAAEFGVLSTYSHDVDLANNIIRNTAGDPVKMQGDGNPTGPKLSYNWTMTGDELHCESTSLNGIQVRDYSHDLTFTSVKIFDAPSQGIVLYNTDLVVIDGAEIDNSGFTAIRIGSTTNTTVRNASITNTGLDGVSVLKTGAAESDNTLIETTDVDTTGRDGIRVSGSPTNLTIAASNTYTNITGLDVNYV